MNIVKRIAMATGAWLQYEFACHRSQLFDEGSLVTPISATLDTIYKKKYYTEFLHPVLAPLKSGPGRRPEVDFAVVETYPEVICAVESKWVGADGIKIEDVVWDLLRLELVVHDTKADAFFVLAGRRKRLRAFFASKAFLGKRKKSNGPFRTILKMQSQPRTGVRHPAPEREALFQKLFADYQNVSFPDALVTSVPERYPEICPNFQYQAYAWRVVSPSRMGRFYPRDHELYGVPDRHVTSVATLVGAAARSENKGSVVISENQ